MHSSGTFKCVERLAGPDGRKRLLIIKFIIEICSHHLELALLALLLRVTTIWAAQERKTYSNYSDVEAWACLPPPLWEQCSTEAIAAKATSDHQPKLRYFHVGRIRGHANRRSCLMFMRDCRSEKC